MRTNDRRMGTDQRTGPLLRADRIGQPRQKNRTFRSVFENTGTGTILIEADMTISMANSGFEKITGFCRDRIEDQMKLTDFICPEDRERLEQYHVGRRTGRRMPSDYQCRLTSTQNGLRHMAVRAQIIDGTGRSVVSFMDITDLVHSKQALQRSEQRLSNLLNNLPGMAYRYGFDAQYALEFASQGCVGLTGYHPSQLTGGHGPTYADLIHPGERGHVLASVNRALNRKESFQVTYRIRTASKGEKWVWEQGTGIFSETGKPLAVEGFVTDFTLHKQMEQEFLKREERLRNENEQLRVSVSSAYGLGDLVGKSESMQQVYRLIRKAAAMDAGVIIYGESGTGKELVARNIHSLSTRCNHRFVAVNCGAVPEAIFESEFFGYRKGAFSGAEKDTDGYLDVADGGTLFLDEIGEISTGGQVKLLRVIDNGGFSPVGGRREKHPNLRIIAATNKDLKKLIEKGVIREDFFYRIHIFPIYMPPLRERKEDIPLLVDRILEIGGFGDLPPLGEDAMARIMAYDWPGNVRELQNTLRRYLTTHTLSFFPSRTPSQAPVSGQGISFPHDTAPPLRDAVSAFEKRYIHGLLDRHQWHRTKVAEILGINRRTLLRKIRNFGIR